MEITKVSTEEKLIVQLEGRLDTNTAPKLQAELLPLIESNRKVEMDFKEMVYVSSAGLRVLLMGEKTAKSKGTQLFFTNVSDEIMEVFDMTGFSNVLNIIR